MPRREQTAEEMFRSLVWGIDYQLGGARRAPDLKRVRYHMRSARKRLDEYEQKVIEHLSRQPAPAAEAQEIES